MDVGGLLISQSRTSFEQSSGQQLWGHLRGHHGLAEREHGSSGWVVRSVEARSVCVVCVRSCVWLSVQSQCLVACSPGDLRLGLAACCAQLKHEAGGRSDDTQLDTSLVPILHARPAAECAAP